MKAQNIQPIVPAGYSVDEFRRVVPIGRTSIYELIKNGKLKSVLICGRRIIPASEADRLLQQSPQN